MNDLQLFQNDDFGRLRSCLDEDGNPWFVAADVCAALDLDNVSEALRNLDDDEKADISITDVSSNGVKQNRKRLLVNEPGLYSLVLRSRKPEAKIFKRWICHEVIPSIRKTGQYQVRPTAQTVNIFTCLGERHDLFVYVSTLRQMARQSIYPPRMRAEFLAEAASLLSGYPISRFLPPETICPLFQ